MQSSKFQTPLITRARSFLWLMLALFFRFPLCLSLMAATTSLLWNGRAVFSPLSRKTFRPQTLAVDCSRVRWWRCPVAALFLLRFYSVLIGIGLCLGLDIHGEIRSKWFIPVNFTLRISISFKIDVHGHNIRRSLWTPVASVIMITNEKMSRVRR